MLACMDARRSVHGILGFKDGDAHVIRNAGRVVSDEAFACGWSPGDLPGTRERPCSFTTPAATC
jgi:carbonic anhydrase